MSKKALHQCLGADLLARRRAASVSQEERATQVGRSIPTVRLVERGSGILFNFKKMATRLNFVLDGNALPAGAGVGDALSALRSRRGMSRVELARLSGVSSPR